MTDAPAPIGPWMVLGPAPTDRSVVMLAQADYHLPDLLATAAECTARGVPTCIVAPVPPHGPLRHWRSSWRRAEGLRRAAAELGLPPGNTLGEEQIARFASALIVRNDWGPSASLVHACKAAGVPTFGWVEGVQDFADADTGRARHAYRSVDTVLTLGRYDAAQLEGAHTVVVGSERLWRMWRDAPSTHTDDVVANVNFSYGVLEEARSAWVRDVAHATRAAHRELLITRHPADKGFVGRRSETTRSSSDLLGTCRTLISRFSTLGYEALVRGVPLVYHNPHGERVPTFRDDMGAFVTTRSRDELLQALRVEPAAAAAVRAAATPFLEHHLGISGPSPAATVGALLAERVG